MPLFDLSGKRAVVVGGGGVLGSAIAKALADAGAAVAVTGFSSRRAEEVAQTIRDLGGQANALTMDACSRDSIHTACDHICNNLGGVDVLVNAAGGNLATATTSATQSFFDLPPEAIEDVMRLNFIGGAVLPAQVIGACMKDNPDGGSIINISSMAATLPLTRIVGYSAAKAAVDNFTRWLAVHFAREYSPKLRVNAIAPGFFLTEQNRFLLTDETTGELTDRGKVILQQTPMGEFGQPDDLAGAALWLASSASRFVTGAVIPVDGGFSAFSGV